MDPLELGQAIRDELALNPEIKSEIDVDIDGDVIRLTGVVTSSQERHLAEKIARRLGAEKIDNDITLESREVSSRDLPGAVTKALDDAGLSGIAGVEKVIDGVVYLSGHAYSALEAEEAIRAASKTAGVRDVVSKITLLPEAVADDATLVNDIEQAISAAGLHVENISASARDGLVHLEGIAWGANDRQLAETAAKSVPGVRGVVNRLRAPSEPLSEDERVTWDVLRRLERAAINAVNISIVVSAGTAFLDGTVDSERQRDEAGAIALATPGVERLENNLSVAA
ncbi:MAG: BON domain-containing protein [Actinobacteria bacterium]|nr:BON domain-containing protein [Actinomycetota bacterium]